MGRVCAYLGDILDRGFEYGIFMFIECGGGKMVASCTSMGNYPRCTVQRSRVFFVLVFLK